MGFGAGVGKSAEKMKQQVNKRIVEISIDLFSTITRNTPIGTSVTKGQLINNWHVGVGIGKYNRTQTSSYKVSGINSYNQIAKLKGSLEFYAKNGEVSFSNSVSYAFRAEYAGWPQPRWSGQNKPGMSYGMVRNSLTAIAAKYRKS